MTTTMARPGPSRSRRSNLGRAFVHWLGEAMMTVGLVMLLLVVYQLYWTNLEANRKADALGDTLREQWSAPAAVERAVAKAKKPKAVPGDAIAIVYIKRLGQNWEKPIVEGVDLKNLARGVGHFLKTVGPGEIGNFSIAAHRATHGEPFVNLDKIEPGDKVIVETREKYFVYTIEEMPGGRNGSAWKLVDPNYDAVVLPVPEQPGEMATEKRITLVTCHPRWGSSSRLIVYGLLSKEIRKTGDLPAELAYTRKA